MTPVHNAQGDAPEAPAVPRVKRVLSLPPRALPLSALLIVAAVGAFVLTRPHEASAPVMDTAPISTPPAVTGTLPSSTHPANTPTGTTVSNAGLAPTARVTRSPTKTVKPGADSTPRPKAASGPKTEQVGTVNDYAVTPAILDPFVAPKSLQSSVLGTAPSGPVPTGALPSLPASMPHATPTVTPVPLQSDPAAPAYRPVPITSAPTPLALPPAPARVPSAVTLPSLQPSAPVAMTVLPAPRALPEAASRPVPLPAPAPLELTPTRIPLRPLPTSSNVTRSVPSAGSPASPAQIGLTTPTTPAPSTPLNPAEQWVKDNVVTYAGRAEGTSVVAVLTTRYGTVYADNAQAIPGTEVTITNTTPKSVELTLGNAHTTLPLTP